MCYADSSIGKGDGVEGEAGRGDAAIKNAAWNGQFDEDGGLNKKDGGGGKQVGEKTY